MFDEHFIIFDKRIISYFAIENDNRATIYLIKKFNYIFNIVLLDDIIFSKREKWNTKTFMEIISFSRKNENYSVMEQIIMRQSINKDAKKMNINFFWWKIW